MKSAIGFVKAKNDKDVMKLYTVCSPDSIFHFLDHDVSFPMRALWDGLMGLFQAFPDVHFSYSDVHETEPNVIVFENYVAEGHHTGLFEFAGHPDLAPTGAYVIDDPTKLTMYVNPEDNMITKVIANTNGGMAGPPGFYARAQAASAMAAKQTKERKKRQVQVSSFGGLNDAQRIWMAYNTFIFGFFHLSSE